jgi:serine/threonine-protein kinase
MPELTSEQLAQRALDLNLLDDRQLQEVWSGFGRRNVPVQEFIQVLLRRELMTNFQLERLLKGERAGFFYGDYKVLYLVAGGTFARVYRAAHKETGVVRALKVLRKRYSDDPQQTEHFCREGMVGMTLRHPNIVPIFEVYSKGLTHFLVMEFVEGHNLREFLRIRKRIAPAEATRLALDMAAALKHALDHGVCHRDMKLTNVLISSRGQAKLVDFGLASTDANLTDESLGERINARTIDYAGLERATGVRKDDLRSDIYFLGVMYYHMLVGRSPLVETRDRITRLSRSRYTDVVPIHQADPTVPRVVAAVVNKAMHLDPERRYQTPGELLTDLHDAYERLSRGEHEAASPAEFESGVPTGWAPAPVPAAASSRSARSVMFVESNPRFQDLLRSAFKKAGYRVLVTSDPQRALARFEEEKLPAAAVVFSASQLGESAVEAFRAFATGERTRELPAILLAEGDTKQLALRLQAELAPHRQLLSMPIKTTHLQQVLDKLLEQTARAAVPQQEGQG